MKHVPTIRVMPVNGAVPVHFFAGPGPMDVRRVSRNRWRFNWYLNVVEGTTRGKAIKAISAVLKHPQSWARTGVSWVRTTDWSKANILVNVIPEDKTECGPGSAGCYSWGDSDLPRAEVGVEYIDDPEMFALLINMELCGHGTFRMTDMYQGDGHSPNSYIGVMGNDVAARRSGFYPSEAEIASAKAWLRGETPADLIHND